MKSVLSILIITIILMHSCIDDYEYFYLPKDMVFQYDSGDVFIYENKYGFIDSLLVYSEKQYFDVSSDWMQDEHQKYELVNPQGLNYYDEYISCIDNCRGEGFNSCAKICNSDFQDIKIFVIRSVSDETTALEEESIWCSLNFNTLWGHNIDNIPGNTYTINNFDYSNSKIFKLKNNENFYLSIDSAVYNYAYGILAYRDIEKGWYKLKTIEELD